MVGQANDVQNGGTAITIQITQLAGETAGDGDLCGKGKPGGQPNAAKNERGNKPGFEMRGHVLCRTGTARGSSKCRSRCRSVGVTACRGVDTSLNLSPRPALSSSVIKDDSFAPSRSGVEGMTSAN